MKANAHELRNAPETGWIQDTDETIDTDKS